MGGRVVPLKARSGPLYFQKLRGPECTTQLEVDQIEIALKAFLWLELSKLVKFLPQTPDAHVNIKI